MSGMYFARSSSDSESSSKSQVIIEKPVASLEWIVESELSYPTVTIYVKRIGDRVLDKPQVVTAFWENLTPQKIRIQFDNAPCSGFVVLN